VLGVVGPVLGIRPPEFNYFSGIGGKLAMCRFLKHIDGKRGFCQQSAASDNPLN
jgi:hypothetical protein